MGFRIRRRLPWFCFLESLFGGRVLDHGGYLNTVREADRAIELRVPRARRRGPQGLAFRLEDVVEDEARIRVARRIQDLLHAQRLAPVAAPDLPLKDGQLEVLARLRGQGGESLVDEAVLAGLGVLGQAVQVAELEDAAHVHAEELAQARAVRLDGHAALGDLRVLHDLLQARRDELVQAVLGEERDVREEDAVFAGDLDERDILFRGGVAARIHLPLDVEAEDWLVHEVFLEHGFGRVPRLAVVHFDLCVVGSAI